MNATRRLAAIMFTDIQGYTKLMQESEAKAVEVRTRHRNIFEPTTLTFGGEIIQYYGDGTLSIFSSTVDAVKCAIEMQIAFQKNPVIPVRIGIHTGDILISDQDIIGDSVNVASRIESLGIAGSITLSKKVADELINHEFFSLRSLGKFHFKNDRTSREVFAVQHPGIIVPAQRELQGKLEKKKLPKSKLILGSLLGLSLLIASLFITNTVFKPSEVKTEIRSLAVLPFSNMLEDRGETYLVDGVHEAIISELQEVGVEVKPRIAMMAYRDTDKSLQQISNELKVDGLIEGAVLKNGDSLMIKIRLINPFSEKYVWIESFDAKFKEAFSLYKEVTRYIAQKIQIALSPESKEHLNLSKEVNPIAYELYLKGKYFSNKGSEADVDSAIYFYKEVLEYDELYGPAYTGLVESYLLKGFGNISPFEAHTQFRIYAHQALELDERLANQHHLKAMIYIFSDFNWDEAENEILQAISTDPNSSEVYDTYCQFLWARGRLGESVDAGEKAVALNPSSHFANCDLTWAYYGAGLWEKARSQLETTIDSFGLDCYYHHGMIYRLDIAEAKTQTDYQRIINKLQSYYEETGHKPRFYEGTLSYLYALLGDKEKAISYIQELMEESNETYIDEWFFSPTYVALGEYDKVFRIFENAYAKRSFLILYTIKMDPYFEPIRQDPRYFDLLKRMGFSEERFIPSPEMEDPL